MHTGIVAEVSGPEELIHVVGELRRRGYRKLDAFTPYPIKGLEQALGLTRSRINFIVFPIAIAGAGLAYLVEWWCNAVDYPLNVGGRPLNSVPAFIPITFEMGVLAASLGGFVVFFILCGLPQLYAPVFDVEGFDRASIDRFWVGIDDRDPMFNAEALEHDLRALGALQVGRARKRQP
jgi:hypothetical protein